MTIPTNHYTKARFFKCALQVNPASYLKFRGEEQTLSEDEYNQQLLEHAIKAKIEVIALADHGSITGFEKIKSLFNAHGIVVFPGFEIASSEKIHFVCLFDEACTQEQITMYLGALGINIDNPAQPVTQSAAAIIDYVNKQNGFIFAAHSTNDDGILKRRMNLVWKNEGLLAAQIPSTMQNLKGVEDGFYRQVFSNKTPDYSRTRKMAAINSADVAKPEDIARESASCLIKMTQPCFSAFKQAFLDSGSRVRLNSDKKENYASAIERIQLIGGYLDGVDIELSEHLNALIGGRGTGKSTLLECIRFAFDLKPFGKAAQKQHEDIIKSNLGLEKGMIKIELRSATMHGRKFTVSRKYGNNPVVTDENGAISTYQPKDLLPHIELYGQNEIYEMTRDEASRSQLVARFLEGEYGHSEGLIQESLQSLKNNRESIKTALAQKLELEEAIERLPKLEEQAKQYKQLGIEEKLNVIPKLEKEKQLNERVNEDVERVCKSLETLQDNLPDAVFLNDTHLDGLPHKGLLQQQRSILERLKAEMMQVHQQFEQRVNTAKQELVPIEQQLRAQWFTQEAQLEKSFKDIPSSQGKTGAQIGVEYQNLLKQIEQIRPKQLLLQNRQTQLKALYAVRAKLLAELDEQTTARASALKKAVKRLNRKLDGKVCLSLQPEGNRKVLFDYLTQCKIEGVGTARLEWVSGNDFSPQRLVSIIREGEESFNLNFLQLTTPFVVTALCRLPERTLLELEEMIIPDTMEIELNVAHGANEADFRHISGLSTGQQCTAVLHLLLLDNSDPLILDQPEDNLDNSFIAERIVDELRRAKLGRQFLFATHNANIPVFGDAEWIGVLSVNDNQGFILPEQQGAIDKPEIQKLAAAILEGGEGAFNQRREKYGFK
jgi:ABC-type lipoprotein export system ATPase subunit